MRGKIRSVGLSDVGRVREHNEDTIGVDADIGLFVLADGMGGYNAGEVASGMATTVIVTEMRQILANTKPYDVDGASNGRGAWLCRGTEGADGASTVEPACLDAALRRGAFVKAWRAPLGPEDEQAIREELGGDRR